MKFSGDALKRIAAANKGKTRNNSRQGQTRPNRPYSEADLQKKVRLARALGEANRGRIQSPEVRAQISQSLKGRVVSEETREKMRLAALKRHQMKR